MRTMNIPFSNITDLKKSPTKLFARAAAKQTGVYIFNRDQPAGVVLDVADYEALVNQNEALQDRVFELEQDYLVAQRLHRQDHEQAPLADDQTVRGSAANEAPHLDKNDGWD